MPTILVEAIISVSTSVDENVVPTITGHRVIPATAIERFAAIGAVDNVVGCRVDRECIDLGLVQDRTVIKFNQIDPAIIRYGKDARYRDRSGIACASHTFGDMDLETRCAGRIFKGDAACINAVEAQFIRYPFASAVVDLIITITGIIVIDIIALTARQRIVTHAAGQGVIARAARKRIIAFVAAQRVIPAIAG